MGGRGCRTSECGQTQYTSSAEAAMTTTFATAEAVRLHHHLHEATAACVAPCGVGPVDGWLWVSYYSEREHGLRALV